jgi:hypothetical protein
MSAQKSGSFLSQALFEGDQLTVTSQLLLLMETLFAHFLPKALIVHESNSRARKAARYLLYNIIRYALFRSLPVWLMRNGGKRKEN